MPKLAFLTILALALPLAATADHHDESCDARASLVVAQLEREAAKPLSASEVAVARRAALASCRGANDADEPRRVASANSDASANGFQRFLSGLFSSDAKPAKKRSGKYRYIEKD